MIRASGKIQEVIDQLATLNKEFRTEVEELNETQNSLISNWTGEASETFHNRYIREEQGYINFAQAIDEYVQALQRILENYTNGESQATSIAAGSR